jgi:hypothetical protein
LGFGTFDDFIVPDYHLHPDPTLTTLRVKFDVWGMRFQGSMEAGTMGQRLGLSISCLIAVP